MNKYKVTTKSGELTQEHTKEAKCIGTLLYIFDNIFAADWDNEWDIVKIELIDEVEICPICGQEEALLADGWCQGCDNDSRLGG